MGRNAILLLQKTRSEGFIDMGMPDIVTAGPLGRIVLEAMEMLIGSGTKVWPRIVRSDC